MIDVVLCSVMQWDPCNFVYAFCKLYIYNHLMFSFLFEIQTEWEEKKTDYKYFYDTERFLSLKWTSNICLQTSQVVTASHIRMWIHDMKYSFNFFHTNIYIYVYHAIINNTLVKINKAEKNNTYIQQQYLSRSYGYSWKLWSVYWTWCYRRKWSKSKCSLSTVLIFIKYF